MKKVFFLTALLCASVMSFAADYCGVTIKSVQGHDATVTMRLVSGTLYEFSITTADNISGFNAAGSNFYAEVNGVGGYHVSEHLSQNGNTLSVQFESTVVPKIYANALFIVLEGIGENQFNIPMDASWAACGAEKSDPGLTLNESEKTLDAASSETFQIQAQQSGDGAITYESSNPGIASVSDAGLVTAVGRGTAVISVKTAETENYALSVKTLTVTVNGPINWEAISWLAGSDDKYKVVSEPEIADKFGGKHIEPGNLWIGFPSADFGDNSSIEHTATGAGVKFPLSQFTKEYNTFNFNCAGVTYAITLYYVDGTKEATAIYNAIEQGQAMKVLENGQLVIIRNGMRYNAAGQYLK